MILLHINALEGFDRSVNFFISNIHRSIIGNFSFVFFKNFIYIFGKCNLFNYFILIKNRKLLSLGSIYNKLKWVEL